MPPKYKLKLKRLDFISPVDAPAQETAKVLLIKRKDGRPTIDGIARVVKVEEGLGLVFCWAFTSKAAGTEYYDLHGDTIDEDFIKVAAEFMESGGATDEMHDSQPDGRVVFAMPMTPEVAKAFGVETDTFGLMVALKPSADVLEKFKSGEYAGVSIAGTGDRIELRRRAPAVVKGNSYVGHGLEMTFVKRGLLTSAEEGHSHLLDDGDGAGAGYTSCECMGEGESATYHSHPWSRNDAGAIVIGMSAGHAHAVLDPASADEATTESDVSARARANKSSPTNAVPTVKSQPTEPTMDPEKQIASLRKQLTAALALSELQRGHLVKLAPADIEDYLEKPSAERETIAKAAVDSDPEVYKTASGVVIRKSHGEVALLLAKQADEQATSLAKAHEALAAESRARGTVELAKRAAETMPKLAKSDAVRAAILKAVEGIADEAIRKDAVEALKSASTIVGGYEKFAGVGGGEEPAEGDPKAVFKTELKKFATEVKKTEIAATADFIRTDRGAELYAVAYPRTQG